MAEGKNSFTGGMNVDISHLKRNPDTCFSISNFKIITTDGSSTGALETEKGTKLEFKIPDLAQMTLTDSTVIPAQSGLRIIGSTTMVDELILFTTNSSAVTPVSYGQIWKCKFNEALNAITGLININELNPAVHLFYNQKLNFSTEYRIGRAIALYETKKKQRVYWTDNYNNLRSFNLAADNPLDTPLSTLDIFSSVDLVQPTLNNVGSGNLPITSQIQFSYRLLNTNGSATSYAPPTPLIPLIDAPVNTSFEIWDAALSSGGKSVTYDLNGLDTSYNAIQHIAILYSGSNVTVYNFAEDSIPSTGLLTVVCSTLAEATIVPIEEYSIINSGFTKCKDIEVQSNRLVAANLKTKGEEFIFDTRAYRFNSNVGKYTPLTPTYPLGILPDNTPMALIRDSSNNNNDIVLLGGLNTTNYASVPDTHDAINIYNKDQEINWFNPLQTYKYKSDGITLGGSGPNISYEFVTSNVAVGNTNFSDSNAPNHIDVPSWIPGATPLTKNVLNSDGSQQLINVEKQIQGNASVWAHTEYVGHARGEVYRYALVTYDIKGQPNFTSWIGDIKFPDVSDGYPLTTYDASHTAVMLSNLGIKFTVDVSSIESLISGYSIVRLDRNDVDKTKVGTGFFMFFDGAVDTDKSSLMHRYWTSGIDNNALAASASRPFPVTSNVQEYGNDDNVMLHLSDKPGFNLLVEGDDTWQRLGYLVSPLGSVYTTKNTDTDYIETLDYYDSELRANYSYDTSQSHADYAFNYKLKNRFDPTHVNERIQVDKTNDAFNGKLIPKTDSFLNNLSPFGGNSIRDLANVSYCRDKALFVSAANEYVPLGSGNPKKILKLRTASATCDPSPTTINHMKPNIVWEGVGIYDGPDSGDTLDFNGTKKAIIEPLFKSVGYRRYLDNQYGGNSYESRSSNRYTYIGHFQTTKHVNSHNLSFDVYGGDTYVNYHDNEYIERYESTAQNPEEVFKPNGDNKLSVAICGPVESFVNTNLMHGKNWAQNRDSTNIGAYQLNEYGYYPIWNQEDTAQNKFFSKDFLSETVDEFPNMLWASNVKINGELEDSWREFPIANKYEVDGIHGPINRILSFNNSLMFYQDKAFGTAALNEKSIIQDQTGQELVLGVGGVFPDHKYYSINTGSIHQFSVTASNNAIYHYDARINKFYRFTGDTAPLSDVKGMSSLFRQFKGVITETDKTTRMSNPTGVHSVFDVKNNRMLFTFLNATTHKNYTISYNELLDVFESFYDYHPNIYIDYGRRLLSVSPLANNEIHSHGLGLNGQYYGIPSTSSVHLVLSNPGSVNKIFNNISFNSELYDISNNDIFNETFNSVLFNNNYQTTGLTPLIVNQNIKRRMRTWHMMIGRDINTPLSRMRNHWLDCTLNYVNNLGKRHVLHDVTYSFTPTKL